MLIAIGGLAFISSTRIISIFRKGDLEVIAIGARALRFQSVTFPLSAWVIMTNMLLQTIGKGTQASIVAISRQGLFFLPAILILPGLLGLLGVQISQPVADIFSFSLVVPLGVSVLREMNTQQKGQKDGLNNNRSAEVTI